MTGLRTQLTILLVAFGIQIAHADGSTRPWLIVTGQDEPMALLDNVSALQSDLSKLGNQPIEVTSVDALTAAQRESCNLIVVGRVENNSLARELLAKQGLEDAFADDEEFAKQQGYVISLEPSNEPAGEIVVAAGWDTLGSVYAVSHLRTHFRANGDELYLDAERTAPAGDRRQGTFRPSLAERGVYYNIGWSHLGRLTPPNWTDEDWQQRIDEAICAQLTHVYFFLWSDNVCFEKSPEANSDFNRELHHRLQRMIRYAHRRGLKVTYQLSPTNVPRDIFKANEAALKADIEYAEKGYPVVCAAGTEKIVMGDHEWSSTAELIADIWGNEVKWFREADEFSLCFYDPGGCFCGPEKCNCHDHQALRMMEQLDMFYILTRKANPDSTFAVNLWPIWNLEDDYKITYEDEFLTALRRYSDASDQRAGSITLIDRLADDVTSLLQGRNHQLRLNGFIFPTNIESGCHLVIPLLGHLQLSAAIARKGGLTAIHHMRIEEPSKYANTYLASRFFWNLDTSPEAALRDYVRWIANTNPAAAEELFEAFMLLESFMCEGTEKQDHLEKGRKIRELVESALEKLGPAKAEELEWLLVTARATKIIGEAVEEPEHRAALSLEFAELMKRSPTFLATSTPLEAYVGWVSKGWNHVGF